MTKSAPKFSVGQLVECEVTWRDGRKTWLRGKVIAETVEEVFIDSANGPVAGDLESAEAVS